MVLIVPHNNYWQDQDESEVDRLLGARSEGDVNFSLNQHIAVMTSGKCQMRITHEETSDNDGIIEVDLGGFTPVGMSEAKFKTFSGSILGSKANAQFAQALYYIYRCSSYRASMKFIWLTSPSKFHLILLDENKELIQSLYKFFSSRKVTPSLAYQLPGIGDIFKEHPLNIARSFVINRDFKTSEFLCETLNRIGIPAEIRDGFNN